MGNDITEIPVNKRYFFNEPFIFCFKVKYNNKAPKKKKINIDGRNKLPIMKSNNIPKIIIMKLITVNKKTVINDLSIFFIIILELVYY